MSNPTAVLVIMGAVVVIALFLLESSQRKQAAEREQWCKERKDLMDRIQAPTFGAYTSKVIAEKKAEKPAEEQETVEFIS